MGWLYRFENVKNGKQYIGSTTKRPTMRRNEHVHHLRHGTHHSSHFQKAWDKYGESCFNFIVERHVSNENLLQAEENLIRRRRTSDRRYGYNMSDSCVLPNRGSKNGRSVYTERDIVRLKLLILKTKSDAETARISGFARRFVCNVRRCDSWAHVRPDLNDQMSTLARGSAKGETIGTSKLNIKQVIKIKTLLRSGHNQSEVARKFNVTPKCINLIANGINWKHAS
jgi:group I intron endonuclease